MSSSVTDRFREVWSEFDPDATSYIKVASYPRFLVALGDPLGWDVSYEYNYLKQLQYLDEINIPKKNRDMEYQFMDVLEHLILIMIIRREVIHFAIKHRQPTLLGAKHDYANISTGGSQTDQASDLNESIEEEVKKPDGEDSDLDESYIDSEDEYKGAAKGTAGGQKMTPFFALMAAAKENKEVL